MFEEDRHAIDGPQTSGENHVPAAGNSSTLQPRSSASIRLKMASAIGLRQVLPVQNEDDDFTGQGTQPIGRHHSLTQNAKAAVGHFDDRWRPAITRRTIVQNYCRPVSQADSFGIDGS